MTTTKNKAYATNPEEFTSEYFESIKGNHAALRQFFTAMPKGGDVHNHLTGSAYAETYFELAAKKGMYVNLETGKLYKEKPEGVETIQLSKEMDNLHNHRMTLIDKWSIRNFQPYKYPLGPDEYFFGTFGLLSALTSDIDDLAYLMHELKVRAVRENVQYLEIIGIAPHIPEYCFMDKDVYNDKNRELKDCLIKGEIRKVTRVLRSVLDQFLNNEKADRTVESYLNSIHELDNKSNKLNNRDISNLIKCRYQGYAVRNLDPIIVFAQLYVVHRACIKDKGELLTGCNIVAAEDGEKSMLYYVLHILMFALLAEKYSSVNTSLHAGELTLGLIRPEYLFEHIGLAITDSEANRIGHGVDLPFEFNSDGILERMKNCNIPVEINLTSNEFILGVKGSEHPIMLYHNAGVPIIISTDDPGILRTSLTEQYTLATLRYGFSYSEIKQFVHNSIKYAFLTDKEKQDLFTELRMHFNSFEKKYEKLFRQPEERCAETTD